MQPLDNSSFDATTVLQKASLFLLAIAFSAVEYFIPRIPLFPWLKPGLANVVTVVWIIRYGVKDALLYTILRIWVVGFYFGFSFVTLMLGLSGGIAAVLGMGVAWHLLGNRRLLGTVGLAIIGASLHNAAQLTVVYLVMAPSMQLLYQVPAMLAASLGFGSLVGVLTPVLYRSVSTMPRGTFEQKEIANQISSPRTHETFLSLGLFAFCMSLVFVDSSPLLGAAAIATTLAAQAFHGFSPGNLFYPVRRFPLLFVFIATLHLFFAYGMRHEHIPWVTREGIHLTIDQWLRLWAWLQTFFLFRTFNFHGVMLSALQRLFPGHLNTVYAGLLALERFPSLLRMVRTQARHLIGLLIRRPNRLLHTLFLQTTELV